jgi:hypothetical protein
MEGIHSSTGTQKKDGRGDTVFFAPDVNIGSGLKTARDEA